jgi:GDSL-like lipase/acylhydrolase family protein
MRQESHPHLVLLGDSIFDNGAYTGAEPDVITHLRAILPAGWAATLCAVDGSTTLDLAVQLPRVPQEASHLVVSIGGNDALLNSDLLDTEVRSTAEALELFDERIQAFEASYRKAIASVLRLGKPAVVCSIYNGSLPDPGQAQAARVALMMFNDVIFRVAAEHRLPTIDLRLVCTEPEDYANPIEPSGQGGEKIARAIGQALSLT